MVISKRSVLVVALASVVFAACKTRTEAGSTVASSAAAAAFGTELCKKPVEAARRRGGAKLLQLVMLLEFLAKNGDLAAAATYEEALKLLSDPEAKIEIAERIEKLLAEAGIKLEQVIKADGTFDEVKAKEVADHWNKANGTTLGEVVLKAAREEIARRPAEMLAEVGAVVERVETRLRESTVESGAGAPATTSPETLFLKMVEEAATPETDGKAETAAIDKAAARGLGMAYFEAMARGAPEMSGGSFRAQMDTMGPQTQETFRRTFLEASAILLGSAEAQERTNAERALTQYASVDNISVPEAQRTAVLRLGEFVGDTARPETSRIRGAIAMGNLTSHFEVTVDGKPNDLVKPAELETLKRLRESYERGVDPTSAGSPPELMTKFRALAEELKRNTETLKRAISERKEVRVRARH